MNYDKHNKTITISQNTGITLSVALIIMAAGAVFTIATWVADTHNQITSLQLQTTKNTTDIASLQTENTDAQVKFSEIQTQLKSIDTTLLDIKERLK